MGKRHVEVSAKKIKKRQRVSDKEEREERSPFFESREDLLKAVFAVLVILFMLLSAFVVML